MENKIMWYMICGIIVWAMGLYREMNKKSVGDADPIVVLAVILFWWVFLIGLLYSWFKKLKSFLK